MAVPQRLKPENSRSEYGAAEAVPLQSRVVKKLVACWQSNFGASQHTHEI